MRLHDLQIGQRFTFTDKHRGKVFEVISKDRFSVVYMDVATGEDRIALSNRKTFRMDVELEHPGITLNEQITPEIKARVFALYFGQRIMRWHQWVSPNEYSAVDMRIPMQSKNGVDKGWYLEVKPLSSITDEDAEVILQLHDPALDFSKVSSSTKNSISLYYESGRFGDYYTVYVKELSIDQADYLRSKGYALPYLDWSVDELVEAKVFELRED